MDTQLTIVALLIAASAAYLLRSTLATWFGKSAAGCAGSCGPACGKSTDAPPAPRVIPIDRVTVVRR